MMAPKNPRDLAPMPRPSVVNRIISLHAEAMYEYRRLECHGSWWTESHGMSGTTLVINFGDSSKPSPETEGIQYWSLFLDWIWGTSESFFWGCYSCYSECYSFFFFWRNQGWKSWMTAWEGSSSQGFSIDFGGMNIYSMDWFRGKFTGKPPI